MKKSDEYSKECTQHTHTDPNELMLTRPMQWILEWIHFALQCSVTIASRIAAYGRSIGGWCSTVKNRRFVP